MTAAMKLKDTWKDSYVSFPLWEVHAVGESDNT